MSRITDEQIDEMIPVSNTNTDADRVKRPNMRILLKGIRDMAEADIEISSVNGLEQALDDKLDASQKGQAEGVAELDSNGKVPIGQIPDVINPVNAVNADLTLTNLHHGKKIQVTDEATITVPSGLRQDFEVHLMRDTAEDFSVVPVSGVTLKGVGDAGNYTCEEGEWIALVKLSSGENYSVINGQLAP